MDYLLDHKGGQWLPLPNSLNAVTFTFSSDNPWRTIDWIYVAMQWRITDGGVIDSPFCDHKPVWAELAIKPPAEP